MPEHARSPSREVWTLALPRALGVPDPVHAEGGERLWHKERGAQEGQRGAGMNSLPRPSALHL